MRTGITFEFSPPDRPRHKQVVKDRNAARKHFWRASIILLSADGLGTAVITRQIGKSKTWVWRGQERFNRKQFQRPFPKSECRLSA
jgi:hypothetical protein